MSSLARYRHGGGGESKEESIDLNPNAESLQAAAALESEIANMAGWFQPEEEEAGSGKGGNGGEGGIERRAGVSHTYDHRCAGSKVRLSDIDTCVSYEEEDTCVSNEEEDTCAGSKVRLSVDIDTATCSSFNTHQSSEASNGASHVLHSPWTPHTPDISLSWGRDGNWEEQEGRGAGGAGGARLGGGGVGAVEKNGVGGEEGGRSLAGEEQLRKEAHKVVINDLVRRLADAEAGFRRVEAEEATMRRMHSLEIHRLQALIREGEAKIAQQQQLLTAAAANAAHTEVDKLTPKP